MAVSLKKIQKWGEKKQTNKLVDIIYLCYDDDIRNVIKEAFLKIGIDSVKPIITHFDENYGDAFIQASCLNILSVFSNPNIIELAVKAVLLPNKEIKKEALNIFFYNQKYSIRYFNDTFKSQEVSIKFKIRCLKALHIIYKVKDDTLPLLVHERKTKVEKEMEYPGQIKVTVIREMRAVEYAK